VTFQGAYLQLVAGYFWLGLVILLHEIVFFDHLANLDGVRRKGVCLNDHATFLRVSPLKR
jgi:hypothetical protein